MKAQPTTRQLIEMLYERIPELFDRPQPDSNTWTPVQIGVDVTSEGVHVVGMYTPPNMPNYVFYSQIHPLAKPEKLTDNGMYQLGYHNGFGFGEAHGKANAPQRTWVELTDEDVIECLSTGLPTRTIGEYARRVEAKLKEKNT